MTVLIADDDPRNNFAMTAYLESAGIDTIVAVNGFEALDLLSKREGIHLVLMDMMMPEMDGYEAIGRMKKDPKLRDIPVIAVTARAMTGDREKCLEAGADEYVSKPVNMTELIQKIKTLIKK